MRIEAKQIKIPFPKRFVMALALLVAFSPFLFSIDFSLRPKIFLSIPLGPGNETPAGYAKYNLGGGGELGFEIDLSTIWPNPLGIGYTLGIEGGMLINALESDSAKNIFFYSFGGQGGVYYFPMPRVFTRIDTAMGVYLSAYDEGRSEPGFFWRVGGEGGFRFTPNFTLAANFGWRQFQEGSTIQNSGMYVGLTAQVTFQTRSSREGVNAGFEQWGALYPAFMQLYQANPIGSVIINNNDNAEIRNVRLSFRADAYTTSEFPCGQVAVIQRGRSVELPLFADFSSEILRFTDTGRVVGELVIRYTFLGQERETVQAVTIAVHNRNRIATSDPTALSAFISPTSPETLDYARYIAGLSRAARRTGHNENMQYAIWLLEGLRASGIGLGETYSSAMEVQFPAETLSFRSGSSIDLALLFSAALEGVGISSAFISAGNEQLSINSEPVFLVAVNLGIGRSAAETLFNDMSKILIINDEVWLPLSMTAFNDGFTACWTQAVTLLNAAFRENMQIDFIPIAEAWAYYPPAPLPELGRSAIRTDNEAALRAVNRALQTYIEQEIDPLIRRVSAEPGAGSNAALQNRLGILLSRAGRIADGKAAYERAAGMGSVPAMTNRGNLALSESDFATAERWFRQALQREPGNRTAQRGLERIAGAR